MQFCILFTIALALLSPELAPSSTPSLAAAFVILLLHCAVVLHASAIALKTNPWESDQVRHHQRNLASQLHIVSWCFASVCSVAFVVLEPQLLGALGFATLCSLPVPNFACPLLVRLFVLVPCVGSLLISWSMLCEADRSSEFVGRNESNWRYVLEKSRGFLLLPLTVLLASVVWSDLVSIVLNSGLPSISFIASFSNGIRAAAWPTDVVFAVIRVLPLLGLVAAFPLLLRYVQAPECLPPSELRARLQDRCNEADFEPTDLLIWNTGQSVRNAAISGFAGSLRYVLLSDRLLAEVEHPRIERIVLHEVAHAIHSHSIRLLLAAFALIASTSAVYVISVEHVPSLATAVITLIFAGVGVTLYGQLARRFELQADLWAAQRSGEPIEYLRAIADVASGHPDRATWLHPSFQSRCEFLLNGFEKAHHSLRSQFRTIVTRLALWFLVLPALAFVTSIAWQCW